jgi:hypothetical protein
MKDFIGTEQKLFYAEIFFTFPSSRGSRFATWSRIAAAKGLFRSEMQPLGKAIRAFMGLRRRVL